MSYELGTSWNSAKKSITTTITADDTLNVDADLKFPMLASTKYAVNATIFFDTTAAADFKWRHTGPASPTLVRIYRYWVLPGATSIAGLAIDTAFSSGDLAAAGSGTTGGFITIEGVIHNGVNAGDFGISWSQNVSDAGNTSVLAGSVLNWKLI